MVLRTTDANGDGKITNADADIFSRVATKLKAEGKIFEASIYDKAIAGIKEYTSGKINNKELINKVYDTDSDGKVTLDDASFLSSNIK